jgi:indolepyruvate ferredoxin oxidoreductase alpha subunit
MTVVILDNEVIAMTGTQPTIVSSQRLQEIVKGLGVPSDHIHMLAAKKSHAQENIDVLKREIDFHGLSVVTLHRECTVAVKRRASDEA